MTSSRWRAAWLATLAAVPAAVVAAVVFVAVSPAPTARSSPHPGAPVPVTAPPPVGAAARETCGRVIGALPTALAGRRSRPVSAAPERIVAWGDPAIVLRCGVPVPASADGEAVIGGVTWLAAQRGSTAVFTTKALDVGVEITVPRDAAPNPAEVVATLAGIIGRTDRPHR